MIVKSIPFGVKVLVSYAAWWMLWIFIQAVLIHRAGFDWKVSFTDAGISNLILALAGYSINKTMISTQPTIKNGFYHLGRSVFLAIGCTFIQKLIPEFISLSAYSDFFQQTLALRTSFNWLLVLLMGVTTWSWVFFRDQQESIQRKEDAEKLSREAELANLRQQLQPHFLFNSLNSISALVGSQPDRARTMIQQLSDFLRGTLKKDDKQMVTLKEELAHVQLYLEIEKVRFGHRLEIMVSASEESLTFTVPSLLLQPLVENAIKFGLYDTLDKIEININAATKNNILTLEIKNPFDPSTASPKKGTGFGLQSVDRRLFLVYAQPHLLEAKQEENTFVTTLKIPQHT